jgi:hypothetical protein
MVETFQYFVVVLCAKGGQEGARSFRGGLRRKCPPAKNFPACTLPQILERLFFFSKPKGTSDANTFF